jgi:hypothetical protein
LGSRIVSHAILFAVFYRIFASNAFLTAGAPRNVQLSVYAGDVFPDGDLRNEKLGGDLAVVPALRNKSEDFLFPLRQRGGIFFAIFEGFEMAPILGGAGYEQAMNKWMYSS